MKILVLCSTYPNISGRVAGMFFHVRNKYYLAKGHEVDTLVFNETVSYTLDGVSIMTKSDFDNKSVKDYDVIVVHAPHVKEHFAFLTKYGREAKRLIFVFHGNEIFDTLDVDPIQSAYKKMTRTAWIKTKVRDYIKLKLVKHFIMKWIDKSNYIFVSKWEYNRFLKYVKIPERLIKNKSTIIYNAIGKNFENKKIDAVDEPEYDFVTIRSNLDTHKYGISIVYELAKAFPQYNFLVIGKGEFFTHYPLPSNITWKNKTLMHDEIINEVIQAKCALLPTFWDTQGVMTCELASCGMPTITSNIEICHEVLDGFDNVSFIDNNNPSNDFSTIYEQLVMKKYKINDRYYEHNTTQHELSLLESLVGHDKEGG